MTFNSLRERVPTIRFLRGSVCAALLASALALTACAAPAASPANTEAPISEGGNGVVAESIIGADTHMGVVDIVAGDMAAMRAFYQDAVGLDVISEANNVVTLGEGDAALIRLTASDAAPARAEDAGLYHSAILYPDEPALAAVLQSLAQKAPELYQGAADHRVSKAFYFGDPEGNGVELYVDTPADTWQWNDGRVTMGRLALDPNAFISEHLGAPTSGNATMGHVHLKVGDIAQARTFYSDVLGFAVTSVSDSSLFLSAGGYHHHIGANTWSSAGAGSRPATLGLGAVEILVANAAELDSVAERLDGAGITHERDGQTLRTTDPWGTVIALRAEA